MESSLVFIVALNGRVDFRLEVGRTVFRVGAREAEGFTRFLGFGASLRRCGSENF